MKTFRLDRRNGKFLGVCAGFADYTGLNANILRIALVVMTVAAGTLWPIIGYFAVAWATNKYGADRADRTNARQAGTSIHQMRTDMRDIDHRLAEIDRYVASPNSSLAREIDSLR